MEIPIIALIIAIIVIVSVVKKKKRQEKERERECARQTVIEKVYQAIIKKESDQTYFNSVFNKILNHRCALTPTELDGELEELPQLKIMLESTLGELVEISEGNPVFNYESWQNYDVEWRIKSQDTPALKRPPDISSYIITTLPILGRYYRVFNRLKEIKDKLFAMIDTSDLIKCAATVERSKAEDEKRYDFSLELMLNQLNKGIAYLWSEEWGELFDFEEYKSMAYEKCIEDWIGIWHNVSQKWSLKYAKEFLEIVQLFEELDEKYENYKKYVNKGYLFYSCCPYSTSNSALILESDQCTGEECERLLTLYKSGKLKGKYMGRDMEQFQTEQAATK